MKKIIIILIGVVFTGGIVVSCNSNKSLQSYFVEKQESNNFIALDLPASLISLNEDVSEETKETISSIKKLNILAFKLNDLNKNEYRSEFKEVKEILKNDNYNELVRMNHKNANIVLKYQGSDEAINEFVLLISDKTKGFALARITGNKMNPRKIMKLVQNLDEFDKDQSALAQIEALWSGINIE